MTKVMEPTPSGDLLARLLAKKPRRLEAPIVLDDEALAAEQDARTAAAEARLRLDGLPRDSPERQRAAGDLELAEQRHAAAAAALEDATVTMQFQHVSHTAYRALLDEHKPSAAEEAAGMAFGEGFLPALMAACSVEPKLTANDVDALEDVWPAAEVERVFLQVLMLNTSASVSP